MILISHRGNLDGPRPEENSPASIDAAIAAGYHVEIDLRIISGLFYLGHDRPDYKIDFHWLLWRSDKLWIHCKNYEAIKLMSECQVFRWFCHQNDTFGIVSNGMVWYSDLTTCPNPKCVVPLLTREQIDLYSKEFIPAAGGICSDYIQEFK